MIIFKNYLKVAKSFIGLMLIYTGIFLGFAVINIKANNQNYKLDIDHIKVAIINEDDSALMKDFVSYVKKNTNYVELDKNDDNLRDALFYRKVDYIMKIPKNFVNQVKENKDVHISTLQVPDSYLATYSQEIFNKYLNTAFAYHQVGIENKEIMNYVKKDLSTKANTHIVKKQVDSQVEFSQYYFSFSNYTFLAIIIMVISMVMSSFNDDKIKNRTLISPVSYKTLNRGLFMGNMFITVGIWFVYMFFAFVLFPKVMLSMIGIMYLLNSFVFVIFALSIGFLLSRITNKRELISGLSNVIALGSSFIAGSFVPQNMLGDTVLTIAKATPSYWFVKNNTLICHLSSFQMKSLQPIFMNMFIIIGFTIVVYIIITIMTKLKMKR